MADTLSVIDSGIGMDRQGLIDNLGTIARSGTKSFLARLTEAKDGAGLIGQFAVGFYSAFMVADRIVVTSRRAGTDQAWTWSSSGRSGFEIAPHAMLVHRYLAAVDPYRPTSYHCYLGLWFSRQKPNGLCCEHPARRWRYRWRHAELRCRYQAVRAQAVKP